MRGLPIIEGARCLCVRVVCGMWPARAPARESKRACVGGCSWELWCVCVSGGRGKGRQGVPRGT
eukprot:1365082-Pleurochrysis_carterae.AAC.1